MSTYKKHTPIQLMSAQELAARHQALTTERSEALTRHRQGGLSADDFDRIRARVANEQNDIKREQETRLHRHVPRHQMNALSEKRNPQGHTWQEWAAAAGYSEAAKRLTGHGYSSPELAWQMGEDPTEARAEAEKEARGLSDLLYARGPYAHLNDLVTEDSAPRPVSATPAIVMGVLGAGLIGTAIYYAMSGPKSSAAPAAAPPPPPPPVKAPVPVASAPKPAPVAVAPHPVPPVHASSPAPAVPKVPTPVEAAPEAFNPPSPNPGAVYAGAANTPITSSPQGSGGIAMASTSSEGKMVDEPGFFERLGRALTPGGESDTGAG